MISKQKYDDMEIIIYTLNYEMLIIFVLSLITYLEHVLGLVKNNSFYLY